MTSPRPKLFCIGLGKTGTSTFAQCARVLGYRHRTGPIFHGLALHRLGDHGPLHDQIARHDSFDDFPWPLMYRDLAARYPEARFVLTRRRDAGTWFRSLSSHDLRYGPREAAKMAYGYYEQRFHPEEMKALYERHLDEVRTFFDGTDRLLEVCWEEGDGWAELCGFLGLAVPNAPFPRMNTAGQRAPEAVVEGLCREGKLAAAIAYADAQEAPDPLRAIILRHARTDLVRSERRIALAKATKGRLRRVLGRLRRGRAR